MRADEEAARVREQAEEERQQAVDAERRLAILRGEEPPPLAPSPSEGRHDDDRDPDRAAAGRGERRNKRKRAGENDTDFEMRVARSRIEGPSRDATRDGEEELAGAGAVVKHQSSSAPLVDAAGHIDLFAADPAAARPRRAEKNPEAEAEAARKKRELEDQYTMRFANAAGFRTDLSKTSAGPWYAAATQRRSDDGSGAPPAALDEVVGRDVWVNEDPRRRDREAARVVASDPLALMKRGAAQVREVARERRTENEERERALRQLRREERRHDRKRRRAGGDHARGAEGEAPRSSRSHRRGDRGHRDRSRSSDDEARGKRHDARKHRHHSHNDGERSHRRHHDSPTRKHRERRGSSEDEARGKGGDAKRHRHHSHNDGERGHRRHHSPERKHGSRSRYDEGARDDRKTSEDR